MSFQNFNKKSRGFTLHLSQLVKIFNIRHKFKKGEGFTMIEILLVLGIISLLASIILVATKGAIEKARISKLLNFSSQVYHALGVDIVGNWNFNENQNITVGDTSGYGNHGEWKNVSGDQWADSIPQLETAGQFDGTDNYVEILHSESLRFKRITVEAWVKPNPENEQNMLIVHGPGVFHLMSPSSKVSPLNPAVVFLVFTEEGISDRCSATTDPDETSFIRNDGKWHHIIAIYNGSEVRIFIDATEFSYSHQNCIGTGGDMKQELSLILLGAAKESIEENPYYSFDGLIDEVRIYNTPLTLAQIKKHYAEGAARHGLLAEE